MSTAGFFLISNYEKDNLLLFPGFCLVAFSQASTFMTDAIAASLFGTSESLVVMLFAGAFDASSGIPLILKKIYPFYSLSQMLFFMACLTSIMHLRTFLQMPYNLPDELYDSGVILKNTVLGKCIKAESRGEGKVHSGVTHAFSCGKILVTHFPLIPLFHFFHL